jgi:hypothetical protein
MNENTSDQERIYKIMNEDFKDKILSPNEFLKKKKLRKNN